MSRPHASHPSLTQAGEQKSGPARRGAARRGPGRPRAADYDRRILEAAVTIFAARGWTGFSFDAIASAAGIGKPAIYRRWPSRGALLQAALTELVDQSDADLGSLRDDIESYVRGVHAFMLTDSGRAWVRLLVEAPFHEELEGYTADSLLGPAVRTFEGITARAVARGEIREVPPIRFLLEMVGGPIVMRVLHSPPDQRHVVAARGQSYVAQLTDWIIAGMVPGAGARDD